MNKKLSYYRSELKSKNVAKYKLVGINAELILNKSLFPKNNDLIIFLDEIYRLTYKKYVIRSRTMIIARVSRDIFQMEKKEYELSRNKLLLFISKYLESNNSNSRHNRTTHDFGKWMDGISDVD